MIKIHLDKKTRISCLEAEGNALEILSELQYAAAKIVANLQDGLNKEIGLETKIIEESFIEGFKHALAFVGDGQTKKMMVDEFMQDEKKSKALLKEMFNGDMEEFKKFYKNTFKEEFKENKNSNVDPVSKSDIESFSKRIFRGFGDR